MRKCATKFCRNDAAKGRRYCHKCRKAKWRKKNPMKAAYDNLKSNAKRRGKHFDLTFEEFKEFAVEVDYLNTSGKQATSITIDRIDETKGYTRDNIQALTNRENVQKYLHYNYSAKDGKMNFKVETRIKNDDYDDLPF